MTATARTQKIFAIDRVLPGATPEQIAALLGTEARHAWELHKVGIIRENHLRTDRPGVVIVLECLGVDEARSILAEFPLVRAGLIEFDLIPVGAFLPLERLFAGGEGA
jgi:hypothetical protein